jgi:dolichol-phosphate mannosyltransferase
MGDVSMPDLKLSVVIPAYNEEQNIRATLGELQPALREAGIPYEIVVVNDCSSDNTPEVVRECMAGDPGIRIINRTPPGGFGRAVRAGMMAVEGDIVAVYMADQSDDPKDLIASYRKIEEGYDCVFGSRFIKGSEVVKYPIFKRIANRIVNKCIQWMFWCEYNDLTNAFKVYHIDVVRECGPYRASHFNITIEMSLSALIRQYNIAQIPISWHGRTWGSSNLRIREMGRRYLDVLLKIYFERLLISDDILEERISNRAKTREVMSRLQNRMETLEKRVSALEGRSPEQDG